MWISSIAHRSFNVSIRSPDRSQGRFLTTSQPSPLMTRFQSAPLTEARGDARSKLLRQCVAAFQSAPLTEARGDFRVFGVSSRQFLVSIRSPDRSQGRCARPAISYGGPAVSIRSPDRSQGRWRTSRSQRPVSVFQSAPLTEARGDVRSPSLSVRILLFQSAPLTEARGDSRSRNGSQRKESSFNPLP